MPRRELAPKAAEVVLRTLSGYGRERISIAAAGITYFALISIFPIALVGLSVTGFVFSSEADQQKLLDNIMEQLPLDEAGGREDLESVITAVVDARGTLGIIGILSALYTGSALFTAVRVALNGIFRGERQRPFVIGKLIDIGMVALFGTLLLASIATSFLLTVFNRFIDDIIGADAAALTRLGVTVTSLLVPPVIAGLVFWLLYSVVPAANVAWRHAIPGAIFAAFGFELLKVGFGLYTANFGNYDATYGSLGFVILLLAFIYFAAQVALLGALVARSTSEVAQGWPFPDDESELAMLRGRVSEIRKKVAHRLGRAGAEGPHLPVAVNDGQGNPVALIEQRLPLEAPGGSPPGHPPAHAARASAVGWLGAAALFGGMILAAYAAARRR